MRVGSGMKIDKTSGNTSVSNKVSLNIKLYLRLDSH